MISSAAYENVSHLAGLSKVAGIGGSVQFAIGTSLDAMEREMIFATLDHCGGNKRRTAKMLGVSLKTLYNRLTDYAAKTSPSDAECRSV